MDALVIGAGLAGSAVARSLAERGMRVTVIEKHHEPAQETSGNPAGIFMPVLEAASSPREAFYLDALHLLLNKLEAAGESIQHQQTGILHLPRDEKIAQRFERVRHRDDLPPGTAQFLNADEASQLINMSISQDCLYYPCGGWLSPVSLCRFNLDHPDIQLLTGFVVSHLESRENQWLAINTAQEVIAAAEIAVIASGHLTGQFEQSRNLPLKQVAGQISRIRTPSAHALQKVICHKGYVLPQAPDELLIGATYTRERSGYSPENKEHEENLKTLKQYLPELGNKLGPDDVIDGRVGYRCVVPGRMPVAGLLPTGNTQNRLVISTAHASRGILSSGICAEIIADQLCDRGSGYGRHAPVVNPARFHKHTK